MLVVTAIVLVALPSPHPASAATVTGRVLLPAPAPPQRMPERYRTLSPNVPMEAPDAPAAIVYLEPAADAQTSGRASRGGSPEGAGPKTVAQRGLQFRPGLLAVRRITGVASLHTRGADH